MILKKIKLIDLVCFFPFLIFLLLTVQFWGQAPSLDPMVIYRETTQFFNGGINEIVSNGTKVHPPLIYIINSIAFLFVGKSPEAYNFVGTSIFIIDSISLYFITKKVFNRKVAIPLTVLLFTNPFIIINSFYLANDMLILSGIILALGFYLYDKKTLLSIILALMVLMKEAALIIIFSFFLFILFDEIFIKKSIKQKVLKNILIVFLPALISFSTWSFYLKYLGTTEWRESFFIKTNDSSYITVIKNLLSFEFLNIYLYQNLRNSFVFNFQWVYSLSIIIFYFLADKKAFLVEKNQKRYFYLVLSLALTYILFVFPFPTWTVPRYGLPIFLSIFFLLSIFLARIKNIILYLFALTLLFSITIVSNIFSVDPVSNKFGRIDIKGENFYNINFWNSGPDRIIYNRQFLKLVSRQNDLIKAAIDNNSDILIDYCDDLKLGEKVYSINVHNLFYPKLKLNKPLDCINNYDLDKDWIQHKIYNKIVYFNKD